MSTKQVGVTKFGPCRLWESPEEDEVVLIENRGNVIVYLGDATVDTSSGKPITPYSSVAVAGDRPWYAIADESATGKQTVYVIPGGQFALLGSQELADIVAATIQGLQVNLVDNPQLLGIAFSKGVPFSDPAINVSLYQSYVLAIWYEAANTGPPANTAIVTVEWGSNANFDVTLMRHTFEINTLNSTDCGTTLIQDAMYGPWMRIKANPGLGAASTVSYALYGSHRARTHPVCKELGDTPNRGLGTDGHIFLFAESVGAGATVQLNTRIGLGPGTAMVSTPTGGTWDIYTYYPSIGSGRRVLNFNSVPAAADFRDRITLAGRVMTVNIRNNGGSAATPMIAIIQDVNG